MPIPQPHPWPLLLYWCKFCSNPKLQGLDYCSNQLQNPFIAEFGDVSLDGRFMQAVAEDVDMLLLPKGTARE